MLQAKAQSNRIIEFTGASNKYKTKYTEFGNSFKFNGFIYFLAKHRKPHGLMLPGYTYGFVEYSKINLIRLDKKNQIMNKVSLDIPIQQYGTSIEKRMVLGDYLLTFYSIKNRTLDKNILYVNKYNLIGHEQDNYKIGAVPRNKKLDFYLVKNEKENLFSIVYTKSSSLNSTQKEALYISNRKRKAKNTSRLSSIDYAVYDVDLNIKKFGTRVKIPVSSKTELINKFMLTDSGELLVFTNKLKEYYTDKDKKLK